NVIVGFVMFLAAALCWPVLAKFMVFTTNGAGTSLASGWISSLGSSASSGAGGGPSGAGAVGGGTGYTKALDSENATAQAASSTSTSALASVAAGRRSGSAAQSAARFGGKALTVTTLGLQALATGKDTLESGLANTAAHAGLDQGVAGGRHVVVPPRRQPTPAPIGTPPPPHPRNPTPHSSPKG
ncbi:hypothetical protein ACFV7Q_12070, partial [Streptomyces sp. NPDC059851]